MSKLQFGDEIRIIAPSSSASGTKTAKDSSRARKRLESIGYKVTFGGHLNSKISFGTANAKDRAMDFNQAFVDKQVKAVMALRGGWSANEILPYIDWSLVRSNPKPIIGFSDITVLINAVYAKTGNIGYLGPNFLSLSHMTAWNYTVSNLQAVLEQNYPLDLKRSNVWSSKSTAPYKTKPWRTLQPGNAEGVLVGGNLGTFYLLQGTEYQPEFNEPFILVAEDDDEGGKLTAREFSRRLESILQLPNVRSNIKGLIIGRFQPGAKVTANALASMIGSKRLDGIPIVSGVDFGHTLPSLTLPIGGKARLQTNHVKITLLEQ